MTTRIIPHLPTQDKRISWTSPVLSLSGVGPAKERLLNGLGISTVGDLLTHYPRDWQDRSRVSRIAESAPGTWTVIRGEVQLCDVVLLPGRLGVLKAALTDGSGTVFAVWFKKLHPRYDVFAPLRKQLRRGVRLCVWGEVTRFGAAKEIRVEEHEVLESPSQAPTHMERIVPVYPLCEGLENKFFRNLVREALTQAADSAPDAWPVSLRNRLKLVGKPEALRAMHFPEKQTQAQNARARLALEEFFLWELAVLLIKARRAKNPKTNRYALRKERLTPFREKLGFDFTPAQKRAINEIFEDLQKPVPMSRLLQGDVGSGKTLVACAALLLAVENGYQGAFLAPTEILAEQHFLTLQRHFQGLNVRLALLTGKMTKPKRKETLDRLASGEIDLVVGTHALLEEDARFARLALAVIDEQHRFGVRQRSVLRGKGSDPDVLVMTATPIPRTLALTAYGDLDVSVLDKLPPGRRPITTRRASESEAFRVVREAVSQGRQAYVVYPLIEESDKVELKAVLSEAAKLKERVFPDLVLEVLHGQMNPETKEKIMTDFAANRISVLVCTTVIEVGIDVPNAAVMVIAHAERFGLATLHQLRGRVGRGAHESLCLLVGEPKSEEARKRLNVMLSTSDGFLLSEEDFKLRGPGDIFGTTQHGLPTLKAGDLLRDSKLVEQARSEAARLLAQDPSLKDAENRPARVELERTFRGKWKWLPVG